MPSDFRRHLAAKRNTPDYVSLTLARLYAVLDGCRFVNLSEIQPSAVWSSSTDCAATGKSLKTANDYLAAAKGFTRWLWRDHRACVDPLAGLSKLANRETDVRHARRDLAPEELTRLLDAALKSRKAIRKLTGRDRHFLYLAGCATGFRASELASLTPESFALDGDTPTVTAEAACTKNRKLAVQPLPRDVATALAVYLADKPAGAPVWPGKWRRKAVFMIRADLAEARRTWLSGFQDARQRDEADQSDFLAYRDATGRYADFHALRHSFITMIGKTGVSPEEHQDLARHSTYALTGRYTHSRLYDLAAAVNGLPSFALAGPGADPLAATGTDGKLLGPFLGLQTDCLRDSERQTEMIDGGPTTLGGDLSPAKNPGKQAKNANAPRVLSPGGVRRQSVEAPGIEPGSRGTEAPASTCVACLVLAGRNLAASPTAFARATPDKQGSAQLTGRKV